MTDAYAVYELESELETALARYLTDRMGECLTDGLREQDMRICLEHLTALLQTISTYVPHHLVRERMVSPNRDAVHGDFTAGTLMMADISGFTAMSERLSELGREGAEEVLGQGYLAGGEYAQAEQELCASLKILAELGSQYEVGKTMFQLARFYCGVGKETDADDMLNRAVKIFERLGAKLDLEEIELFREEEMRDHAVN